jgi:hypothetical protein
MCRFSAFGSGIVARFAIGKYSTRSSFVTGCGATPSATGHAGSVTAANCGLGPLGAPSEDPFVVELPVEEPPGAWPAAPCAAIRLSVATNTSTKAPTIRIRIPALLRQANPPPTDVSISYVCAEVRKGLPQHTNKRHILFQKSRGSVRRRREGTTSVVPLAMKSMAALAAGVAPPKKMAAKAAKFSSIVTSLLPHFITSFFFLKLQILLHQLSQFLPILILHMHKLHSIPLSSGIPHHRRKVQLPKSRPNLQLDRISHG